MHLKPSPANDCHDSQAGSLLGKKHFLPLFLTQFLGAFNDNVFKNALIILLTFHGAQMTTLSTGLLVNLCAGLFILPFFLFSATAGQFADKYEKAGLIRLIKLAEIAIMLIASLGFVASNLACLLTALFLMGTHSAFFGPLKYSILPQHIPPKKLISANALIEGGTFIAILLGTLLGGVLIALGAYGPIWIASACLCIAILGFFTSRAIPPAQAADPDLLLNPSPLSETLRNLRDAYPQRALFLALLAISWFWFYGAIFLSQFPAYAKNLLGGDESVVTLLLAIFTMGIGIGSALCEWFSRMRCTHSKLPQPLLLCGAVGLSLFACDLYFATPTSTDQARSLTVFLQHTQGWRILFDLLMIGTAGGLYCVPLYTLLQTHSLASHRSRIIATNNIVNALFMVIASLFAMILIIIGCNTVQIFLITALLNLPVIGAIYYLAPMHWK